MLMRPLQWVKNLFVFAPLVFALQFTNPQAIQVTAFAMLAFILASSAVYIINDIRDLEEDKLHPRKKHRPLASGVTSVMEAAILLVAILVALAFTLAMLPPATLYIVGLYVGLNIAYSFFLKQIVLLDVLVIAAGFVLRVLMGGYAIDVVVSPWLVLATFMLALFLGFGKRYTEFAASRSNKRQVLDHYNADLLRVLVVVSCTCALMTYAIYTAEVATQLGNNYMVYTVIFVVFGLFRYLYYLFFKNEGEAPERILVTDPLFLGNLVAWGTVTIALLHSTA